MKDKKVIMKSQKNKYLKNKINNNKKNKKKNKKLIRNKTKACHKEQDLDLIYKIQKIIINYKI